MLYFSAYLTQVFKVFRHNVHFLEEKNDFTWALGKHVSMRGKMHTVGVCLFNIQMNVNKF